MQGDIVTSRIDARQEATLSALSTALAIVRGAKSKKDAERQLAELLQGTESSR